MNGGVSDVAFMPDSLSLLSTGSEHPLFLIIDSSIILYPVLAFR